MQLLVLKSQSLHCSSSRISLQSVDLTAGSPVVRSRSSSLQSSDSLKSFSAGVLHVLVHQARKLEKKGMFGKADPYVLITFGPSKTRSKTINNNQNPEWNWSSDLSVDNPSLAGHVLLEIFDDDIGKDDLLGVVAIPTTDILRGGRMARLVFLNMFIMILLILGSGTSLINASLGRCVSACSSR